jgi:hypothetical protein
MVSPVPAGVREDLIIYFTRESGQVVSPNTDVRHACGYSSNPIGWRGLSGRINMLPHVLGNNLRLDPTDMDGVRTIKHVETRLRRFQPQPFAAVGLPRARPPRKRPPAKKPAKRKPRG